MFLSHASAQSLDNLSLYICRSFNNALQVKDNFCGGRFGLQITYQVAISSKLCAL